MSPHRYASEEPQHPFPSFSSSSGILRVTPRGRLTARVSAVRTVYVDGVLVGDVDCKRLNVGRRGRVIGDVVANEVVLNPGASARGRIRVGREAVDHRQKKEREGDSSRPTRESMEEDISMERNEVHRETEPTDGSHDPPEIPAAAASNVDHFGNPLLSSAGPEQVRTFRLNRERSRLTRELMDDAARPPRVPHNTERVTRPRHLPAWEMLPGIGQDVVVPGEEAAGAAASSLESDEAAPPSVEAEFKSGGERRNKGGEGASKEEA